MAMTINALLVKHAKSLSNASVRGRKVGGCIEQIAKYEALRIFLLKEEPATWETFCKSQKLPVDHTAYHFFYQTEEA